MNIRKVGRFAVLTAVVAGSIHLGVKVSKTADGINEQIKECVKNFNPEKYDFIINSKDRNNLRIWNQAIQEINDSLKKMNSECEKSYFQADTLINKSVKTVSKSIK